MKKAKRLDGKYLSLHLTKRLEVDMRTFCRDKGIESESELIRQAIGKYIYADYKDETLKLQGLKQLQQKISELRDMNEIIFSFLCFMNKSNLAYHPEIDPELKEAAYVSATNRHDKFINSFRDTLKNNPPMFEKLLHTFYSESGDDDG